MTKLWCVGGRHYSITAKQNIYEKLNPKTKNLLKLSKENVFVNVTYHKFLLRK